jgi:hypothetical protein
LAAGVSVAESANEIDNYPRLTGNSGDDVDEELLAAAGLPLLPNLPLDYNYLTGDELQFRMQTVPKSANVAAEGSSGSESSVSPLSSEQSTTDANCFPDMSTSMPITSNEPGGDNDGVTTDTQTFGEIADKIRAVRLWHGLQVGLH